MYYVPKYICDVNIIALHAMLVHFVNNSLCKYVKENNYKNTPLKLSSNYVKRLDKI